MSAWTVERLEGLPEGTLIEWTLPGGAHQAVKEDGEWWGLDPVRPVDGGDILAAAHSTLAAMALAHYSPATEGVSPAQWEIDNMQHVAHAAVAHVTGGAQ